MKRKTKINIRKIGPDEAGLVAELSVEFELFLSEIEGKRKSPSKAAYERQIKRALSGPEPYAHCLVAEADGRLLGHATYNMMFATAHNCAGLFVEDLFVRESARSMGVGKALLDELKKIAKDKRCGVLALTVWNRNPRALGFYLSQGGKPADGDIIMEWKLK